MSKGLVGIIANDAARFSEFGSCVTRLQAPEGWEIEWVIGGDWCGARNNLVQLTLEGGYSHLWFMDDDHSFSPDILLRLLAHGLPVVNPLCLTRTMPFVPCVYPTRLPEGEHVYLPVDFETADPSGVIEIEAGGCAGMLIRRDVLEAVAALPGRVFEYGDRSEDIIFCEKAKACGYTLYADLGVHLGHITTAVVWPSYDAENGWTTGLTIGKDMQLSVPYWSQLLTRQMQEQTAAEDLPTTAAPPAPDQSPEGDACERIEIWMDDELRWWWRALNQEGEIIARDSAINEGLVIAAGQRAYPDAPIHQIPNELADSRNLQRYGPPMRLWNRGNV